jgi:hypothetical protein
MTNDSPIRLAVLDDSQIVGRVCIDQPAFAQNIVVPVSGDSGLTYPGTKCEHGVYIPANSPYPTMADYCSVCWPYKLSVKHNAQYLATKKIKSEQE